MGALKHDLYYKAFSNTVIDWDKNEGGNIKEYIAKAIYYGIKTVITKPKANIYQEAIKDFQFANVIMDLIGTLTPGEFMNIFPINKIFTGHKYDTKDYFYTRDYINTLNPNEPIGDNKAEFLWEYTNINVTLFNVQLMSYMDTVNKLQGKPTLTEEFIRDTGLKTYSKFTDQRGREFFIDSETGKTKRVNKPRPKHLKLIK